MKSHNKNCSSTITFQFSSTWHNNSLDENRSLGAAMLRSHDIQMSHDLIEHNMVK